MIRAAETAAYLAGCGTVSYLADSRLAAGTETAVKRWLRRAAWVAVVVLAAAHVAEMMSDALDRELRRHPVMF